MPPRVFLPNSPTQALPKVPSAPPLSCWKPPDLGGPTRADVLTTVVGAMTPAPDLLDGCEECVQRRLSRLDSTCPTDGGRLGPTLCPARPASADPPPAKTPPGPLGPGSGKKAKKHMRTKRALCVLGWTFCFPLFFCYNCVLRSPPLDEDDMRGDPCYTLCVT